MVDAVRFCAVSRCCRIALLIAAVVPLACSAAMGATVLDIAPLSNDGNGFSALTFNQKNTVDGLYVATVGGRLGVGDTLDQYGLSAGGSLTASNLRSDIIVGNHYNAQTGVPGNGGAPNGNIEVGTSFTTGFNYHTAPAVGFGQVPNFSLGTTYNFSSKAAEYKSYSAYLGALDDSVGNTNTPNHSSSNAGFVQSSGFGFNSYNPGGTNVVNFTFASGSTFNYIFAGIDPLTTLVVNIHVTPDGGGNRVLNFNSFGGGNFYDQYSTGSTDSSKILFNFSDATAIHLTNAAFFGSILAPNADVSLNSASLTGGVISDSLQLQGSQITYSGFTGTLPSLPEPASASILLVPSIMLLGSRRQK